MTFDTIFAIVAIAALGSIVARQNKALSEQIGS